MGCVRVHNRVWGCTDSHIRKGIEGAAIPGEFSPPAKGPAMMRQRVSPFAQSSPPGKGGLERGREAEVNGREGWTQPAATLGPSRWMVAYFVNFIYRLLI
jgi:hypothetical protein